MKGPKFSPAPIPVSIDEAWERLVSDALADAPPHLMPTLRDTYYRGAMAALHQVNAGRYMDTAVRLNRAMFERADLSPNEIVDTVDQLMDGTFEHPPGYAKEYPIGLSRK